MSFVSKKLIRELSSINAWHSVLALSFDWGIIIGCIFIHEYFQNPLSYICSWIIIGSRMNALYSLLHEGVHFQLLAKRKINDWVSRLFLAWPLFFSLPIMRKNHLAHHQHLHTAEDPEQSHLRHSEFQFPRPLVAIATTFVLDILGVNFIMYKLKRLFTKLKSLRDEKTFKQKAFTFEQLFQILYYCILIATLLYNSWLAQFTLYWILPYITIYQAMNRLRLSTEHFLVGQKTPFKTRTLKLNLLESFFLSPHNLGYHTEHHLYPSVPFYNLKTLHQLLMKISEYRSNALVSKSYFSSIKVFIKH